MADETKLEGEFAGFTAPERKEYRVLHTVLNHARNGPLIDYAAERGRTILAIVDTYAQGEIVKLTEREAKRHLQHGAVVVREPDPDDETAPQSGPPDPSLAKPAASAVAKPAK